MTLAIMTDPPLFEKAPQVPQESAGTALMTAPNAVSAFERIAADPNVSVEKLERLIAMQERVNAHTAKAAFDAAFAEMQGEIPIITEKGEILVNGQLRSRYARLEDVLEVIRPVLARHGFAIRHRNEFKDGLITITGVLSHRGGHSEEDQFVARADTSGGKNENQALGSTRAYGIRYTTIALVGIATRGEDDDAASSGKGAAPEPPKGYDDWLAEFEAVAVEGLARLEAMWKASKPQYRDYLTRYDPRKRAAIKAKAEAVRA